MTLLGAEAALQPALLSHSAHTPPRALQAPFPLLQKQPSDLDPLTGMADVWDEGPAAPRSQSPRCPLEEGRALCISQSSLTCPAAPGLRRSRPRKRGRIRS